MSTINEQIVTGRKFRKLIDEATKLWQRISFWTKASDVEFDDGNDAETKVGAIDGITDSLTATSSNIALSAKAGNDLQNQISSLNTDMTAGLQQFEVLPIADSPDFIYTATKRCDIYVTVVVEAGNSQGGYLINGITVASIGYAWTATNPARHMIPAYFALQKGDVFQVYAKENIAVQRVVVRY